MANGTATKLSPTIKAAKLRRLLFIERWLTNGHHATEAAIYAGYSEHTAGSIAGQIMARADVKAIIAERAATVIEQAHLTTERWAKEMAAVGHFDIGQLYDSDGALIPVHKLPEQVRRAISSVKIEHRTVAGETITTEEIKTNDKNTALANIGRHLGVFEKDNRQVVTAIQVNLKLVG